MIGNKTPLSARSSIFNVQLYTQAALWRAVCTTKELPGHAGVEYVFKKKHTHTLAQTIIKKRGGNEKIMPEKSCNCAAK